MSDEPAPEAGGNPQEMRDERRAGRPWLAYLFFVAAIALFAAAVFLYFRDDSGGVAVPTAQAGHNEMKDVMLAFEEAGLNAEYGRSADRAVGLTEVAQPIVVDGVTIYVFIYSDPSQRERDQNRLDPAALQIVNTRGTPVAEGEPAIYGGSNVLVAVYGGDSGLHDAVERAIAGLR